MPDNSSGPVKTWLKISTVAVLVLAVGFLWFRWKQNEPQRLCLSALQNLHAALNSSGADTLLNFLVLPQAIQTKTTAEKIEFVRKALQDEISLAGLKVLQKEGAFGPLKEIFPAEANAWVTQAGVSVEDCVAFKLERSGLRTEVVLYRPSSINHQASAHAFRVVRMNNVKQLAANL